MVAQSWNHVFLRVHTAQGVSNMIVLGSAARAARTQRSLRGIVAQGERTQHTFGGIVVLGARTQVHLRWIVALGARTQCNLLNRFAHSAGP
eukprot:1731160-Pyramimonas_sp.AAC.1